MNAYELLVALRQKREEAHKLNKEKTAETFQIIKSALACFDGKCLDGKQFELVLEEPYYIHMELDGEPFLSFRIYPDTSVYVIYKTKGKAYSLGSFESPNFVAEMMDNYLC